MSDRYEWMNDDEVTLLNGDPIPDTMDFPLDPPAEIGQVHSVYSTCVHGRPLTSKLKRSLIIFGVYLIASIPGTMALGFGLHSNLDDWIQAAIIGGIFGLFSLPFSWIFTRPKNWVGFVGELGLAQYKLGSTREKVNKAQMFEFQNAIDLYTSATRQHYNGVYVSTSYSYEWRDVQGKKVFKLAGSYNSKKDTPKPKNPYYLGTAAEVSWSMFLADAINIELQEQGAVHFKVNKKDWVKVGPGFIEFNFKNKDARLAVEDIKDLSIGDGQFSIKSNDAGWFGGKGKYRFAYGKMANARLFLLCLEQLCGYRFD